MKLEDYTEAIILDGLDRLSYLYGMKRVMRYNQTRDEQLYTESVAEHLYGMNILAQYFLPLENPEHTWDRAHIYEMITLHDIDEIETGDVLGYTKTPEIRAQEIIAMRLVAEKAPTHMRSFITERVEEYEKKESIEARFTRAIDKMEPLVHIYHPMVREIVHINQTTIEQSRSIKDQYVTEFPFISKFNEVVHKKLDGDGLFWTPGVTLA
jgi:5'-deoxynucleotidase YfbR-like HD superfamily hydrolase